MTTIGGAFLLSLACAAVFTPMVIELARRIGALDHALSSRKIHGRPVPRLGGVAIVAAFFVPIGALWLVHGHGGHLFDGEAGLRSVGLFAGGATIALLGLYDDLKGAGARLKLSIQLAVGAMVYFLGFRIGAIANPFGPAFQLGWLGLPFTMLWVAGVINAMNLIDGLDGLAAGVALVAVAMTFVFALLQHEPLMMLFSAALAGALLGFFRWNFNPASVFMGDTGSMFIGFVLATSSIQSHHKSSTAVAILVPIVVLGVPIADTLLAIWRRSVRGAPLFQADRAHLHHRLLDLGLSQRAACFTLWGASLVLGLAALALAFASSAQAALILLALAVVAVVVLRRLGYMQLERAAEVLALRRHNLERRAALSAIAARLRRAADLGAVWETVLEAAPILGAGCVELHLDDARRYAPGEHRTCTPAPHASCAALFRTRHSLRGERPDANVLELGWADRAALDRDVETAVEALCGHLRSALARIANADVARASAQTSSVTGVGPTTNANWSPSRRSSSALTSAATRVT